MRNKDHNKYMGAESMEDLTEGGSGRSSKADSDPKTPDNEASPAVPSRGVDDTPTKKAPMAKEVGYHIKLKLDVHDFVV